MTSIHSFKRSVYIQETLITILLSESPAVGIYLPKEKVQKRREMNNSKCCHMGWDSPSNPPPLKLALRGFVRFQEGVSKTRFLPGFHPGVSWQQGKQGFKTETKHLCRGSAAAHV